MSNDVGRTALVTGSARGMGRAIAERLAETGYDVVGVDIARDSPAGTIRCDLSSWKTCAELIGSLPKVDVLVNNAAVFVERSPEAITEEDFELMVAVNLRAPFVLTRESSKAMRERGWGRIINISSISARTGGLSGTGTYAATKAGLIALTKYFARLYASSGVTVNAVAPGAIEAPMALAQRARNPHLEAEIRALVPMGRWGEAEEVARLVEFLAGEGAGFITGATIDINGGWVMT